MTDDQWPMTDEQWVMGEEFIVDRLVGWDRKSEKGRRVRPWGRWQCFMGCNRLCYTTAEHGQVLLPGLAQTAHDRMFRSWGGDCWQSTGEESTMKRRESGMREERSFWGAPGWCAEDGKRRSVSLQAKEWWSDGVLAPQNSRNVWREKWEPPKGGTPNTKRGPAWTPNGRKVAWPLRCVTALEKARPGKLFGRRLGSGGRGDGGGWRLGSRHWRLGSWRRNDGNGGFCCVSR